MITVGRLSSSSKTETRDPARYPTGALRVLYADEDIRIFTNRADSPDRWESEGLVVVQVRDELFA